MGRIKVAVVGVGNCCSALVQGVYAYKDHGEVVGLMHEVFGGYTLADIEFVAAFDVDARKVGRDLSEAIFVEPNCYDKVYNVPRTGVTVKMGEVKDGVGEYISEHVKVSEEKPVDVARELKDAGAEVVVNLIPTGGVEASRWYAEQALKAGCAFINATPAEIAVSSEWASRFQSAGLPLVGDDLMDQAGATVLYKALLEFLVKRGVRVEETYQLDIGGGLEALNTLQKDRGDFKRHVKTAAVKASLPYEVPIVAGTTDYVSFMRNSRASYFWVKGSYFNGAPIKIDIFLNTVDAPNAAGILVDVIRGVKLAMDKRMSGVIFPL
ncbi:MAG: hypothetical protein QXX18_07680, partial [Candidatus Jordarchaeales archaeon]